MSPSLKFIGVSHHAVLWLISWKFRFIDRKRSIYGAKNDSNVRYFSLFSIVGTQAAQVEVIDLGGAFLSRGRLETTSKSPRAGVVLVPGGARFSWQGWRNYLACRKLCPLRLTAQS